MAGDAGHHKEFVIGDGITEALIQAKHLSKAILEGSDIALARWWRARDVEAILLFYFDQDEGSLTPPGYLDSLVLKHVDREPETEKEAELVMEHKLSPFNFIPASSIMKWVMADVLRGQFNAIPDFLAKGRRALFVKRQLKSRMKLLAKADASV